MSGTVSCAGDWIVSWPGEVGGGAGCGYLDLIRRFSFAGVGEGGAAAFPTVMDGDRFAAGLARL